MAITPIPVANFRRRLYQFLYQVEGDVPFAYNDSNGIPTLGVGYALLEGTPGKHNWVFRLNLKTELINAGITSQQFKSLNENLTLAMNALNGVVGATNPFPSPNGTNILGWTITTPQLQSLFNTIIPTYETQVKTWLGNDALYAGLQGSYEMLALVSLAYNGVLASSTTLKKDILAGNRADAWFQIRYGSNLHKTTGVAKRRYEEAAMFGLYNDNNNVTVEDAMAVYRMFTEHRDTIVKYDNAFLGQLANANSDLIAAGFASVGALTWQQDFQYAADALNKVYGNGNNFSELNIYDASSRVATVNRSSDNGADLIIGGTSNSTLTGGTGSDTFVYLPPSTGATATTETIDDSRGKGNGSIYVGNKVLTASSTVIKYSGTNTRAWKMAA